MEEIGFVHYEDAQDVVEAFFGGLKQAANIAAGDSGSLIFTDGSEMTEADVLSKIEAQGHWGFCDETESCIHVWFAPDASLETRIAVYAHELAHLFKDELDQCEDHEEEERSDLIAEIAIIAYEKATELRGV